MNRDEHAKRSPGGRLLCPSCGSEMNFHAEKLNYGAVLADARGADAGLGGVVDEFHTCPCCSYIVECAARRGPADR